MTWCCTAASSCHQPKNLMWSKRYDTNVSMWSVSYPAPRTELLCDLRNLKISIALTQEGTIFEGFQREISLISSNVQCRLLLLGTFGCQGNRRLDGSSRWCFVCVSPHFLVNWAHCIRNFKGIQASGRVTSKSSKYCMLGGNPEVSAAIQGGRGTDGTHAILGYPTG